MQTLEEQVRQIQNKNINKMPKNITMEQAVRRDDVQSILKALPSYKDNKLERFAKGAISGLQSMADVVPAIEIYGQQADLAIGGYFGAKPEVIQRKALNLATSYRNLQARQQERYKYSNPEDVSSFAYGLGQGAFNYGLMLLGGGLVGGTAKAVGATATKQIAAQTFTGLGANVLLENVEQQSERMPLDKLGNIDVNKITPEWAKDSAIGTTAYLGISTLLEKGFGFGKQVKMWETPIKTSNRAIKISSPVLKSAAKSALSEGMTEGLQSLTSTGILLAEGKIDVSQLPERLQDAWKEAVIGGLLGGTAGTAVGINQAHNVKTMLTEEVSKVVTDPEECEKIVDAIYDSGTAEMTNVISKELELSSELNTKHGAIYDIMQGAIYDAINNAGAFTDVSEAEIAQYVSETSKMFANQVLAEANKRGVLIDDVLKASDIKFENGKIYMKAGKEVIAETQAVTDETGAEIGEETNKKIDTILKDYSEYFNKEQLEEFKQELEKFDKYKGLDNIDIEVSKKSIKDLKPEEALKRLKDSNNLWARFEKEDKLKKRFYDYVDKNDFKDQRVNELARFIGGFEKLGLDKPITFEEMKNDSRYGFKTELALKYLADKKGFDNYSKDNEEDRIKAGFDKFIEIVYGKQSDKEETATEQETKIARYQELQTQLSEIGKQAQAKVLGENYKGKITEEQHKQIDIEADKLGYGKLWKEYSELSKEISAPERTKTEETISPETNAEQNNTGSLSTQMEETPKEENIIQDYGEHLEGAKKDKVTEKEEQNKETDIEKILKKVKASKKEEVKDFLSNLDSEYIKQIAQLNLPVQTYERNGETELLYRNPKTKYWYTLTPETLAEYKNSLKKIAFTFAAATNKELYLWGKKGSGSWLPLLQFETKEEMEKYKQSHSQEELENLYDEMTSYKSSEKEIRERKGEDYRKGKNITEKELAETFGFRGVQFGNYENNAKRQKEINNTYDSLKDLAKILNIPDKAISLDGSLGIAFGARGSGKAAAHYESDSKIINITRDAGAGALAHEWFHALDDYLGRTNGNEFDNFITKGRNYTALRSELKDKFIDYINGINKEKDFKLRLRRLGAYWKRNWEISARIFEQYVYNKTEANNEINDYLAQDHSKERPYLTKEEQQRIFPLLDAFFNELKYAETDNGYKLYQLKNTPKQPKVFKGAFDYSIKAIELFKDADYSTLPHELAHYWLDNMWGYYRSGKASEAYINNFKGVLDWLGVDEETQTYFTRAQQEKFARGYEKYLLNGYAPSGLIQGAFDDYDKWLQKVYNDARELKVKLTPDAIQFFDTMTTGELPDYDVPETQAEIREKNIEQMNKDIETARKFVVEKQTEYNNFDGGNAITKETVPVTTEGEKKQSRAYTNQASILGIAEELNYNKADIAEQNKLASEYVKNNLDEARQVVNGEKEAPKNILKNAIYNAYLKEMLAIGDNEAYVNALKNQSLELTRAGQEISSQRGAIENIFDSGYWIRRIENLKKSKLAAQKFGNGWTASEQEQALSKMNDFIKNKVEAVMSEFMDATAEEQKKIAEKLSKDIAAEFKVKPDTKLYQSMYEPSEVRTRTNAYNYIYKYINSALGLDLTKAQYNEIIAKTTAIQKSIETTRNRNGNPSALFFKNVSELENYANSIEPSPALAILTSTVGRGNMLFSPKTIALNIESNIVNFFTEAITRRIQNGAVNMAVDPQVIKDYLAYSREVFNTSGYQVSSMPTLDPTTQILSEKMTTTGGDRIVDKLGRFFEQTIFKYGLGAPDLFFKDMTFVDTANVLATKEAKGDSKKATELFKDICLIEPKTAKGKELREIAINEALIATYQNKGKTSDLALGIRNAINKATGSANVGDMLSPFVKTPANVIGLGFDYSMGGLYALKNIQTIYNDIQNGTFTETTRTALRSLARNGIGFVAAMLIASLIDDDDYIPEYALLDAKERELVKMKGGVFNSIKIGDKYISLDYFGPLAMPLVSYLNARRGKDVKNKIWNYFQGSAYQALKLPVIGDIKSLLEGTGRTLTKDADENIKMATEAAIDFVSSRSIPAIVTDIAKMTDDFERETNNDAMNRLKSKVPVLREELPMQYNYGTGQPRLTQNPISQLFAGARIKEEVSSPVIREIDRLNKSNVEDKVNISKVTKLGKLSTLNDSQKIEVEKKFAQRYANAVDGLLQTNYYNSLDDGGKVKAINKIKDNIRNDLKVEYGLEAPPKPKKRKGRKRRRSRR